MNHDKREARAAIERGLVRTGITRLRRLRDPAKVRHTRATTMHSATVLAAVALDDEDRDLAEQAVTYIATAQANERLTAAARELERHGAHVPPEAIVLAAQDVGEREARRLT